MNFAAIFALVMRLAIPAVLTVQQVIGDRASGADKKTMALDALNAATNTALSLFAPGSNNAIYAQAASTLASATIDAAVLFTKSTGHYQAATLTANNGPVSIVSPVPTPATNSGN